MPITFTRRVLLGKDPMQRRYFFDKWGFLPKEARPLLAQKAIWIDVASGGEVLQIVTFCRLLKEAWPNTPIFVSTESSDAFQFAQSIDVFAFVFYTPWDLKGVARRVLGQLRPAVLIAIELTRMPILFREAQRRGIKTVLLSALMDETFQRHTNMRRAFRHRYYQYFDYIGVKEKKDREGFLRLGVDEERLWTTGDMKYDPAYILQGNGRVQDTLKIGPDKKVLMAGSIYPGEEEITIQGYTEAKKKVPNLKLVIAPRYADFIPAIETAVLRAGLSSIRKTRLGDQAKVDHEVIIVDTFGELPYLYSVADFVFVGGSINPVTNVGSGKNPVEPLLHGKPIFFGPYMNKWRGIKSELMKVWNGCMVSDYRSLAEGIIRLHSDQALSLQLREKALQIVSPKGDFVNRSYQLVERLLVGEQP
jgi:3-deoxy-D-manno-octulosonic-acid transferase